MAFDTYESSRHNGRPIKLFKFMLGPLPEDELRYTDAESVQAFESKDYQPIAISTGKMTANGTLDNSALTVNMQGNTELHNIFRIWPPSYVVGLIVYQGHSDDPDNQFLAAWGGRVINAAWPNNELKLTCEPTTLSFRRSGLRRNYQRSCPHALYGRRLTAITTPGYRHHHHCRARHGHPRPHLDHSPLIVVSFLPVSTHAAAATAARNASSDTAT